MKIFFIILMFLPICKIMAQYVSFNTENYCGRTEAWAEWHGTSLPLPVSYWQTDNCGYSTDQTTITVTETGTYYFRTLYNNGSWSECEELYIWVFQSSGSVSVSPDTTLQCEYSTSISASCQYDYSVSPFNNYSENIIASCGGIWTQVSGPEAEILYPNWDNTEVQFSGAGVYTFRYTVQRADCDPVFDDVTITVVEESNDFEAYVSNKFPMVNDFIELTISSEIESQYSINWGDGDETNTSVPFADHIYEDKGFFPVIITSNPFDSAVCTTTDTLYIESVLCVSSMPDDDGQFVMDKLTGAIVYRQENCGMDIPFDCFSGPAEQIPEVIASQSVVFNDAWTKAAENIETSSGNQFENSLRGKWRTKSSYAYNSSLYEPERNYKDGHYDMYAFTWENAEVNRKEWLKQTTVEHYSPNGDALQERNALNIASTTKFGYYDVLPILTASNAEYSTVLFESFEVDYEGGKYDNGLTVTNGIKVENAHSGRYAISSNGSNMNIYFKSLNLSSNTRAGGLSVKFWSSTSNPSAYVIKVLIDGALLNSKSPSLLATTGQWSLMEVILPPGLMSSWPLNKDLTVQLTGQNVIIDDFRIQPLDSQMSCYVYDANNLRLLAVFDDQHYGLYYHYNAEGKLVRKLIETERGTRTIQETFYNQPGEKLE